MVFVTVLTEAEGLLCPVRNVLANVTGKWQSLILLALEDEALRFSALRRAIGDITQRVLTENLRSLERDGYLTRRVVPGPPVEVHYELTDLGRDLVGQFKPLVLWAIRNFDRVQQNRKAHDAT
jgi:DNA-binding HxlR family transcriptional regulator